MTTSDAVAAAAPSPGATGPSSPPTASVASVAPVASIPSIAAVDGPEAVVARARLEDRLDELRAEHDNGRHQLARLTQQHEELAATLGRITGAITVLEELLAP